VYELVDVTKTYPKGRQTVIALDRVSLTVRSGEFLAVQGSTGHGKSTLLQMLGGLDRATQGTVELDGADLSRLDERALTRVRGESIGFVFQSFNLLPTLSAQENVEAALVPLRIATRRRRLRAAEALESVGLGDRLTHLPSELSGGQQQRVAIARALVKQPKVLLADEPTGNLDADTRNEILRTLIALWEEHGLTMVLVTHDARVAAKAQRVVTMKRGRLTIRKDRPASDV
jgi:putative ABC transport system ATP-binding protein